MNEVKNNMIEIVWEIDNFIYYNERDTFNLKCDVPFSTCTFHVGFSKIGNDFLIALVDQVDEKVVRHIFLEQLEIECALLDNEGCAKFFIHHNTKLDVDKSIPKKTEKNRFLDSSIMLLENKDTCLPNGMATIRIRIWGKNGWIINNECAFLKTTIPANSVKFSWSVENFNNVTLSPEKNVVIEPLPGILYYPEKNNSLNLVFTYQNDNSKVHNAAEWIKFQIKEAQGKEEWFFTKPWFFIFDAYFVNRRAIKVPYISITADAPVKKNEWLLKPSIAEKNTKRYNFLLLNNTLGLNCEFVMVSYDYTTKVDTGFLSKDYFVPPVFPKSPDQSGTKETEYNHSQQKIYKQLRQCGFMSDFTLKVESKAFPVHKAILGIQSTLFHNLFLAHGKEKLQNNIEENGKTFIISNFDVDTVSRMVDYMYFGDPGELNDDVAAKLYLAAKAYEMTHLKELAVNFMKKSINKKNVCILLDLAYQYDEDCLKSSLIQYIACNQKAILSSSDWIVWLEENAKFAGDVLYEIQQL